MLLKWSSLLLADSSLWHGCDYGRLDWSDGFPVRKRENLPPLDIFNADGDGNGLGLSLRGLLEQFYRLAYALWQADSAFGLLLLLLDKQLPAAIPILWGCPEVPA